MVDGKGKNLKEWDLDLEQVDDEYQMAKTDPKAKDKVKAKLQNSIDQLEN